MYLSLRQLYKLKSPHNQIDIYMYTLIGIKHMINGMILDMIIFCSFSLNYQELS